MATVFLNNVSKVFPGGVQAVRDFDLQVGDGEFVVLVGPSGCGKSTTLRMIAGLEEITGGAISIGDRIVNDIPPKDRDIAMVFQNYALYPHMTVRENMAFGLKLRKYSKTEIAARIGEAAEILGLAELLDRQPKELSGGQRQRVAVGRAIVRKPAVFLFDEPLSNLDAKLRAQMRVEISRLHQQLGATMIYVTHDQVEAMTMGQRIVVMKDGWIQQVAAPMELYENPANLFVAGFIGTPPMNFFQGCIRKKDQILTFEAQDGFSLPVPEIRTKPLAAYVDKPVTLGVRPEDIGSAAPEQGPNPSHIPAVVDVIEPMGAESFVYLTAGSTAFVMRVKSVDGLRIGQTCKPLVQGRRLLFFDATSGEVIPVL